MARVRNLVIYNTDRTVLERLRDEYRDYCGREVSLEPGKLIVFATPQRKRRTPKTEYKGAA